MKTLIIHDTADMLGQEIIAYLKSNSPDSFKFINLNEKSLKACMGCFNCWLKTPGLCPLKDEAQSILKAEINSDRVLYLCPVTWGGFSPSLKIYMDRSIGRALPFFRTFKRETHHPPRYEKNPVPFLVGYGKNLDEDEIEVFKRTGENLSDNLHKGKMQTLIIRRSGDISEVNDFLKGESL